MGSAERVRHKVIGVLGGAKPPPSNVTLDERLALKELRRDENIMILPADKGRATVLLDTSEYENKMSVLLSDMSTYKVLTRDPTPALQRKMNGVLLKLKKENRITPKVYNRLRCSSGTTPHIYGLPKVHKENVPLRPIVSFCTSPTYSLSRYLATLLSPLVGGSSSHVRNSRDFVSFMLLQQLQPGEILVSFDVVSLFTRIPITLALQIARKRLEEDDSLADRTPLSIDNIISLLDLCLNATFFMFRRITYQQVFGTAMGSPVSVVVANLVLEDVEERALKSFGITLSFWKRYVDDVCTSVPKDLILPLLHHLNSIEPSIEFTYETENDEGCLPFLDTMIHHQSDGSLSSSVYRKPTHTDRYLNFNSHHPLSHKVAVIRTLVGRAGALCSSGTQKTTELSHVEKVLRRNHYPARVIERYSKEKEAKTITDDNDRFKATITLPYVRGTSEAIKRILSPVNIRVCFRPCVTLKSLLVHPKDTLPLEKKANVVYCLPCQSCSEVYIGQTSRLLEARLGEHKADVRKGNVETSAVAEHIWSKGHRVDWQKCSVLMQESDLHRRCFLESWFIQRNVTMNREAGSLSSAYNALCDC